MAPRWKWKGAEAKALAEPISNSVSELQLSLAKTETSGSLSSCNVLLAVEPEQAELLDRCCFGRLVLSAEKDKKWIQLSFEEAFYLLYNLKCIKIYLQGRCLENEVDTWMYMKSQRPNFPIFFKAYSHLRSKNWVLRSGLQYGVDFVAYRHHPSLVHSEYSVLVQSGDSNRLRVWSDVHCAVRLSGSVAKTLLTLHVSGSSNKEDLKLPMCLENYKVEEQTICRWSPELNREDETTNPKPNATTSYGNGSPDVPKKLSPRAARPLKLAALETDSSSSPISANNRIPKDTSPKVSDRKPPPSPFSEKRPSRTTELESLASQLQYDLKKAKQQVTVSETSKRQAEQEAEESRKQLQEVSSKLQETKNQVLEEETDKTGAFNHRSVSQGWDLEFGATTDERGGLDVVVQEIRQLKLQIEMVASSEADHVKQAELRNSDIHLLRGNLKDTLFLVENFSNQLKDCEVTDAETKALATETLRQLENAKKAVEELKSDGTKEVESYKKMAVELEQSKSRMVWLGGLVTKLLANPGVLENHETLLKDYASLKLGESNEKNEEVSSLRCEVERLRAALEASGKKDQEGNVKASSRLRIQAELRFELKTAKSKIDKLEARLVDKETELKFISEENDTLCLLLKKNQKETDAEAELKQQREVIKKLKADLMDKETQLQIVSDQNETLKSDIHKRETDIQDVLMKLGFAMREAEKSSQRAVRVTEELDATRASNSAMKTELDKLKARLVAKETELQFTSDENDNLYLLLKNQKETDAEAEAELKQQREVIEKLKADLMDKETQLQIVLDKNETLKSEMGTELRELRVQSNQLREDAEKANAMLSAGNNNNQRNSPYSEDINDEVQRRKQGISLRRLVFGGRSRRNGWRLTE
uniref:tRNA-intron lyase n=1 Tax=Brassica campestris TaxID=3711 RepID=M4CE72_BRACM